MNNVQLVGRLAAEVDLKEVSGGSKVCSFILAVDRSAEEADFPILPTPMRKELERNGTALSRREA